MEGIRGDKNNDRRFKGIKGRRPDNKKFRQDEAVIRLEAYNKLTTAEKIAKLDMMFGKDQGAKKQRAKLAA